MASQFANLSSRLIRDGQRGRIPHGVLRSRDPKSGLKANGSQYCVFKLPQVIEFQHFAEPAIDQHTMPLQTRWGAAFVLIFAGVISALQIGKAAIAVPVLQRELALTLVAASWIVGAYGVLGAIAGLPAGILSSLLSARATLIAGLDGRGRRKPRRRVRRERSGPDRDTGAWKDAARSPPRSRCRGCCAPSPRRKTSRRCWRCLPRICRSARWS